MSRSFVGEAKKVSSGEIDSLANLLGVEPAAFRAVIAVEAAGSGFDAKSRPKALFERHLFYRHLAGNPDVQAKAVEQGLAYRAWGMKPYPKGSDGVYAEIEKACELDDQAALLSTSWGLGQVLGSNFRMAGCTSVDHMLREAMESEGYQLRHMACFISSANLVRPLQFKDWRAFAKGYNGPGYEKYSYHTKLENAYATAVGKAAS